MGLRPLTGWDCGFESIRQHGCLSLVSVVCYQIEFSTSGRSIVQRSLSKIGGSECDSEASIKMSPWTIWGCCTGGGGIETSGGVLGKRR